MHANGQGARRDLLAAYAWLLQAERAGVSGAGKYMSETAARMNAEQRVHVQRLCAELEPG
jgi:TPR repeat protein